MAGMRSLLSSTAGQLGPNLNGVQDVRVNAGAGLVNSYNIIANFHGTLSVYQLTEVSEVKSQ